RQHEAENPDRQPVPAIIVVDLPGKEAAQHGLCSLCLRPARIGRTAKSPPVSWFLYIMRPYIAPGNDGNEDNDRRYFKERLPRVRIELIGEPQRQRDAEEPDRFPEQFVDQQRQHLQRIADTNNGEESESQKKAVRHAAHQRPMSMMQKQRQPYGAMRYGNQGIDGPQQIEAEQRNATCAGVPVFAMMDGLFCRGSRCRTGNNHWHGDLTPYKNW